MRFALALVLTPIYLRWGNLWPLGAVHGWLAIPTYFWIAGVDPWAVVTVGQRQVRAARSSANVPAAMSSTATSISGPMCSLPSAAPTSTASGGLTYE